MAVDFIYQPGHLLAGKYRVVKPLGVGGMGQVFVVEHVGIGRRFALKVLLPEFRGNKELVARFEREARMAAGISHEHVVQVTDVDFDEQGSPFFVMELLEGESLEDVIARDAPLPLGRAVAILDQVLDGLGAAHARGIVHRDLKPANVFLAKGGKLPKVKLLDFGISKQATQDPADVGLTRTGMVMGTPQYMAPEQARGSRDVDHRVD
ncbi:MAG: serine/threonine-protein kinase, partial [Myxococcota bacterium]